jgi:single-strand DNA-binding protein
VTLTKGKQVYVEGRLKSRTYQTQGGETGFSNDINVTDIQLLGQRDSGAQDQAFEARGYQEADLSF